MALPAPPMIGSATKAAMVSAPSCSIILASSLAQVNSQLG